METLDPQERATRATGRDPLDDATYQILRMVALRFQARRFIRFPQISICKTCASPNRHFNRVCTVCKDKKDKDKDKEALFNVAYNVTDNISS